MRSKYIKTIFLAVCFLSFNTFFMPAINAQEQKTTAASIGREEVQLTNYNMGFFEKNMLGKANKLYEQKKYDEALAAYQELRDKYIDNPLAWYGMGAVYYAGGIYDLAIAKFSTAIKIDPNFSTAIKWLGNCYMKKGNKEEAAKYWKMAEEVLKNKLRTAGVK